MQPDHWSEDIAEDYDYWTFADANFSSWQYALVKSALQIDVDDLFADIGCGTGTFAKMFVQDLNQPVACIDPNNIIDALSSESASFGVQKFKMTGEEYLSYHSPTKLLIKEVWHHLGPDYYKLLSKISIGRILLVYTRISSRHLPFPKKYHWEGSSEEIISILQENGFSCTVKEAAYHRQFDREEYRRLLKTRFWSNLENITDKEIDEYVNALPSSDPVDFVDRPSLIVATKVN